MSRLRRFASALSPAVLALLLPLSPAQAEDCVRFNALNHCGLGSARVSLADKVLRVDTSSTSGEDGVAIDTGLVTDWTAAAFIETDEPESKTVLSSVSEGVTTSSATIEQQGEAIAYTFTGKGENTTYSLRVYSGGNLKASLGGIYGGMTGVISHPSLSYKWSPSCRPIGQTYMQCRNTCHRYGSCDYCSRPCGTGFQNVVLGAPSWRFEVAYPSLTLPDGRVVEGDELVMTEESSGTPASPGFEQILIQTTAKSVILTDESVVSAK